MVRHGSSERHAQTRLLDEGSKPVVSQVHMSASSALEAKFVPAQTVNFFENKLFKTVLVFDESVRHPDVRPSLFSKGEVMTLHINWRPT
jgi:hypothetical protein